MPPPRSRPSEFVACAASRGRQAEVNFDRQHVAKIDPLRLQMEMPMSFATHCHAVASCVCMLFVTAVA